MAVGRCSEEKVKLFENVLSSFKINYDFVKNTSGEFFDIYDIRLSPGSTFKKIEKILPDLGVQFSSHSIPRGYPVYKDGVFRVEIQKRELAQKTFLELYKDNKDFYIPITLGVNTDGSHFQVDLNKIPNLLIGGIPGSGKSVLLNSIILSLIYNDADLYLVDPKMVEFNLYAPFKNTKILATTVEETFELIKEVNEVMEDRFEILRWSNSRNVHEYNESRPPQKKLSPVVVVIDEWADIVLQNKAIQKPLCSIAQKGRAAGISIVLATQRPSSSVISGLIKANFSGRICLRVASNVDSRVILDRSGGEKIMNIGEGLYLDQRLSEPKMFKSTFIEDPQSILMSNKKVKNSLPIWKRIWL